MTSNSTGDPSGRLATPITSRDEIVFVFAGDLWRVPLAGGDAVRLTSHPGRENHPQFSPDGSLVAFIHPASAHGVLVELKQLLPEGK